MRILYLRNVPDGVVAALEVMARRSGMSVNALAVRELAMVARRADNPRLLSELADLPIDPEEIVAELDAGRSER